MIEVINLNKSYGDKHVLSDVTFSAENGIVTGFVGPNGAGKSTTMRMIAALEVPDAGQALVDGQPFERAAQPLRTMGIYLGSEYLPLNMTGKHYLEYVCHVGDVPKTNIPALLQAVELTGAENRKISSYSLGMKQRIGLAAAIAGQADTLMLDEPVNGLDPMGVQWLRGLLKFQASQGKAVLLSSHLLSELEVVADKVVMLDKGVVIKQGMMDALAQSASSQKHVVIHTSDDVRLARSLAGRGIDVRSDGDSLIICGIEPQRLAKLVVTNNIELFHLEEKHPSLEELFMASTASAPQHPASPTIAVTPQPQQGQVQRFANAQQMPSQPQATRQMPQQGGFGRSRQQQMPPQGQNPQTRGGFNGR